MRHVGKMSNTDQRVVVVLMQIPNNESNALVVSTDNLPPMIEQAVSTIVQSPEAQSEVSLLPVLGRRLIADTGRTVLQTLHEMGLLQAVPVEKVIMLPHPNMPFPLPQVIAAMGGTVPVAAPPAAPPVPENAETTKFNPFVQNQAANSSEEKIAVARTILMEAADLEAIAMRKREQAYALAPSLRPDIALKAPEAPAPIRLVEKTNEKPKAVRSPRKPRSKPTATKA